MITTIKGHSLASNIDKLRLLLIGMLIFYIFCFQYVFYPINGFLTFLGAMVAVLEILRFSIGYYKRVGYIFTFIVITTIFGLLTAYDINAHVRLVSNMIQYCLPMIAICGYVRNSRKKLSHILQIMSFTTIILSVSLIFNGVKFTDYGAVTIGDLNTNVLSCFLMIGLLSQLLLLCECKKTIVKVILFCGVFIELIAQMRASSRRGLVIFIFLLGVYFLLLYFVCYKKNFDMKFLLVISVIAILVVFAANFYSLADKYVILRRLFMGEFNYGDVLREKYQSAAFELFKESPILGQGFGCVAAQIGMYSHSMYYETLASTGMVGGLLLFCPILSNMLKFFKKAKSSKDEEVKMKCYIGSCGFLAILLSGIAVVSIFDAYFYIMLGILGALGNVIFQNQKVDL